jgi:hypothetical protein
MTYRYLSLVLILLVLLPAGCSYRFVDPFPASEYALASVRNATGEAGLATLLEEEMLKHGGFKERSANRLSVTVTGFTETVESVSSDGIPVRQKLTMDVAWKVEGTQSAQTTFGKDIRPIFPPWTGTVVPPFVSSLKWLPGTYSNVLESSLESHGKHRQGYG